LTKTPLIYSVSRFNLRGLGALFGRAKPTKAPQWRRECTYKNNKQVLSYSNVLMLRPETVKKTRCCENTHDQVLVQGSPTWYTSTPRGTFASLKAGTFKVRNRRENVFLYYLFSNVYTYIGEYYFQKSLHDYC